MAVKPEIADYIKSHTDMVISEAKEILGTVTNKEIELEFQGAEEFNFDDLSGVYAESVVGVDFKLPNDPDGKIYLLIPKPTAARIGSLMMMMEDEEVEFSEDHIDAMKEMTNQIMGALSTKMKETDDVTISPEDLNAQEVELNAEMFDLPELIMAKFSLKIGEDDPSTIMSVMTSSSIESIMPGEAAAETAAEDAETEAVEDAEPGEAGEAAEGDEESGDIGGDLDISGMLEDDESPEEPAADEIAAPSVEAPPSVSELESKFDFLMDLTFPVSIELGRTKMLIKDILDLGHGSVIEFEKLAGEPVDLLVDDKKIAEGEVVVVDEHFGIRITSLIQTAEMLKDLSMK